MKEYRYDHSATLLSNGNVLVAAGMTFGELFDAALASAEMYDAIHDSWSTVAPLARSRRYHTATLLSSGLVLIAGGYDPGGDGGADDHYPGNAQLFDPMLRTWSAECPMLHSRASHSATLLNDGSVLVAGGTAPVLVVEAT